MIVTTNRTVKGVSYTELVSTYRKAKFNRVKLNLTFNTRSIILLRIVKNHMVNTFLMTQGKLFFMKEPILVQTTKY